MCTLWVPSSSISDCVYWVTNEKTDCAWVLMIWHILTTKVNIWISVCTSTRVCHLRRDIQCTGLLTSKKQQQQQQQHYFMQLSCCFYKVCISNKTRRRASVIAMHKVPKTITSQCVIATYRAKCRLRTTNVLCVITCAERRLFTKTKGCCLLVIIWGKCNYSKRRFKTVPENQVPRPASYSVTLTWTCVT